MEASRFSESLRDDGRLKDDLFFDFASVSEALLLSDDGRLKDDLVFDDLEPPAEEAPGDTIFLRVPGERGFGEATCFKDDGRFFGLGSASSVEVTLVLLSVRFKLCCCSDSSRTLDCLVLTEFLVFFFLSFAAGEATDDGILLMLCALSPFFSRRDGCLGDDASSSLDFFFLVFRRFPLLKDPELVRRSFRSDRPDFSR